MKNTLIMIVIIIKELFSQYLYKIKIISFNSGKSKQGFLSLTGYAILNKHRFKSDVDGESVVIIRVVVTLRTNVNLKTINSLPFIVTFVIFTVDNKNNLQY